MPWIRKILALALLVAIVPFAAAQDAQSPQALCDAAQPAALTRMQFEEPEDVLEDDVDYRAIFCTTAGAIYLDLFENLTPITVNNFVFLAGQDYYDSTTFHRVIPEFMAQAGDPTATGSGGPGYQFADEPVGFLTFDRPGLLAMANAGPGTNGSQFFITTVPTAHLNYKHTIFGEVLAGQDNVSAIRERDPQAAAEAGETLLTVLIISDPAQVDAGEVDDLASATQDEVVSAFDAFLGSLPPSLPANVEKSGLFTSEQVAESVTTDLQEAYAAYVADNGHQYRYRVEVDNVNCDANIYFTSLGYQVDVFESAAAAALALRDNRTMLLLEGQGFAHNPSTQATYSKATETCAGEEGSHALSLYTYGRFLVSIDVLVANRVLEQAGVTGGAVLADLSMQIEQGFGDLYRPEIRA